MSIRSRPIAALLVLSLLVTVTGCGLSDPYVSRERAPVSAPSGDPHEPAAERGGQIAAAGRGPAPAAAAATQRAAIERYAMLYVNWSAASLPGHLRTLAAISVDGARASALQAAATTARDAALRRAGVRNSGSIVALAPGRGAALGRWVLVTRETTSGDGKFAGLPENTLHITYAAVRRLANGWVVSSWYPQQ